MVDCKPVTTPMELDFQKLIGSVAGLVLQNATEYRELIGALIFLVNSRSDIHFEVSMVTSYMVEPHQIGAMNLLRYLWGTIYHRLRYTTQNMKLNDYSNANQVGSMEDRKRTSKCQFSLVSASISQMSRKQKSVAISIETKYVATSMTSCEVS